MGISFGKLVEKRLTTSPGEKSNLIPVVDFIVPKTKLAVNKRFMRLLCAYTENQKDGFELFIK